MAFVIGTRPEAIKLLPVCRAAAARGVDVSVILTGQHTDLMQEFLSQLNCYTVGASTATPKNEQMGSKLSCYVQIVADALLVPPSPPDYLVVQGDTLSALAGALAGMLHTPWTSVVHVEAGVRSLMGLDPWPEEMIRRTITQAADIHFAPTEQEAYHLRHALHASERREVHIVGNTVADALIADIAALPLPRIRESRPPQTVLVTCHRRDNIASGVLQALCDSVQALASAQVEVVWPIHPNPEVREVVEGMPSSPYIKIVPPMGRQDFLIAMLRADVVVTDSGGVQEECTCLHKRAVIIRDWLDRVLTDDMIQVRSADPDSLQKAIKSQLRKEPSVVPPEFHKHYGAGDAAEKIIDILLA